MGKTYCENINSGLGTKTLWQNLNQFGSSKLAVHETNPNDLPDNSTARVNIAYKYTIILSAKK